MKYIQKAIAIILAAIFLAAVLIGVSVIFAIRNINLATVSYSSAAGENTSFFDSVDKVKSSLSSLSGKNLVGIGEDDVSSLISSDGYARFVSVEKVYPCTLNVTVEERLETFTVRSEESGYLIYDELGAYITSRDINLNNLDGCPNVIIDADADIQSVAQIASVFKEKFSALRSIVESISVTGYVAENSEVLAFTLYSGLTLRLVNYTQYTEEKINALYSAYQSVGDLDKTEGSVSCHSDSSGQLYITLTDGSIYKV